MTVIIVNRDMNTAHSATVNLNAFPVANGSYKTLQLASLPATETFKSHTDNALKENTVTVKSNSFTVSVPALSTTAVILPRGESLVTGIEENRSLADNITIFPNPVSDNLLIKMNSDLSELIDISVYDMKGHLIKSCQKYYDGTSPISLNASAFSQGFYLLYVRKSGSTSISRFAVIR